MLKINNITLSYDNNRIVNNVSCHFKRGKVTAIIGPNGCGKSTLLKAIAKSKKIDSGTILLNGHNINKIKHKQFAKMISILPQNPHTPFDITVRQLVTLGRHPHLNWRNKLTSKDKQIIDKAIRDTSLTDMQDRLLAQMSGGEKQRSWIAMTIAQEPELLLLDEPTTYLDINYQYELLELVKKLNKKAKITIVMVLHDINQAARYADSILALKNGEVYGIGSPMQIINYRTLKDVYNIDAKILIDENNNCPLFIPLPASK